MDFKRRFYKIIKWLIITLAIALAALFFLVLTRPGTLYDRVPGNGFGVEAPDTPKRLIELRVGLQRHVDKLASEIKQRSYLAPAGLDKAAKYITDELSGIARSQRSALKPWPYKVVELPSKYAYRCAKPKCTQEVKTDDDIRKKLASLEFKNIELEILGTKQPNEVIIIGAHYDSDGCESAGCNLGADDNATGVAALLELARIFQRQPVAKTIRFVAFTNEEEPFFQTELMGSYVYARQSRRAKDKIVAMLSLETMGYFSSEPDSQRPWWIRLLGVSTAGNYITFVGDWDSTALMRKATISFRGIPSEGFASYRWFPGLNWSDHWSYWQIGVPAIMVTDTALARNLCYHKNCDIPQRLDYDRLSRVVLGLAEVIKELGN